MGGKPFWIRKTLEPQIGLDTLIACLRIEVGRIDAAIAALKRMALSKRIDGTRRRASSLMNGGGTSRIGAPKQHRPRAKADS